MTSSASHSEAPIKVSTPADILSYVPHILGFQPRESLVFLTMTGKRVGATLRLDLPCEETDPLDYADSVCEYLQSDSAADGVLMVIYTDRAWMEPAEPPFAPLVHCLDLVLDAAGLSLLDGSLVSSSHWRDYFCEEQSCCPWPGHRLTAITESVLNAELVFQGSTYAESLESAVRTVDAVDNEEVHRLTFSYIEKWAGKWDSSSLARDCLTLWDGLIRGTAGSAGDEPEVRAFLLAGLTSAAVRDSLILLAATDATAAYAAAVDGSVLPAYPEEVQLPQECDDLKSAIAAEEAAGGASAQSHSDERPSALFRDIFLATMSTPDWNRLDAAHRVFVRLTAVAQGKPRSALLSILGWLEWTRGRGSRAHHYLQAALDETPGYTLAELLLALVGTGSLAPWARRRETAWTSDSWRAA